MTNDSTRYSQWLQDAGVARLADGLAVYPALSDRVERLLASTRRDPQDSLGLVAPALLPATVRAVAVQAAMAACPPEAFDVVLAAVAAALDETAVAIGPEFNLEGVQATACSCAPLVVVSGDAVTRAGLDYRRRVLASTAPANAAIGRTIRLVLANLGGAWPGETDLSVIGNPAKYGYCVAEHPASPWEPLHVARGLGRVAGAVTLFACDSPHQVVLTGATTPLTIAQQIAGTLRQAGSLNMYWGGQALIAVNLPLARQLTAAGWGRADLAGCLYELARRTPADCASFYEAEWMQFFTRPPWSGPLDTIPAISDPRDLHIIVTGEGDEPLAAVCPGWGAAGALAITVPVLDSIPTATPTAAPGPVRKVGERGGLGVEVVEDLRIGALESGSATGDRPVIPLATGARSEGTRILLFANYGPADGSAGGIMHWLKQQLGARPDVAEVGWFPSPLPTRHEPQSTLIGLAAEYDAVIVGIGLSGSRSWKVAIDAVQFERLGRPTVTLVARGYEEYILTLAAVAGLTEQLPLVLIEPTDPPRTSGFAAGLTDALLAAVRRPRLTRLCNSRPPQTAQSCTIGRS